MGRHRRRSARRSAQVRGDRHRRGAPHPDEREYRPAASRRRLGHGLPLGWHGRHSIPTPDAAAYTALLEAAYTAITAADRNAVVVEGVIEAASHSGIKAINSVRFLTEMYEVAAAEEAAKLEDHKPS